MSLPRSAWSRGRIGLWVVAADATEADPRISTAVKTAEILLIMVVSFLLSPPVI